MNGDDRKRWEETRESLGHIKSDIKTLFAQNQEIKAELRDCKEKIGIVNQKTTGNTIEIVKITTQLTTLGALAIILLNIFL